MCFFKKNQEKIKTAFVFFLSLFLSACFCNAGKNRTNIELIQDMMQQKNIKAQEGSKAGVLMQLPPEHTQARNRSYYQHKGDPASAEKHLVNPFQENFSAFIIGLGKRQYDKACVYCHGPAGAGGGRVAQKMMVKPLSLLSEKAINYSDGKIYHIIYEGQGLMGSYSKQVSDEQARWALVNYVRMLQRKAKMKDN